MAQVVAAAADGGGAVAANGGAVGVAAGVNHGSGLALAAAGLVLVVCLQVLLHVVGAGELLLAAGKGALNSLFGSVNLGVARRMAGCGKRLVAAVRVAVAAWVALGWALGDGGAVVLVRGGAAGPVERRTLLVLLVVLASTRVVDGRRQGRNGGLGAEVRVIRVRTKQLGGVW